MIRLTSNFTEMLTHIEFHENDIHMCETYLFKASERGVQEGFSIPGF